MQGLTHVPSPPAPALPASAAQTPHQALHQNRRATGQEERGHLASVQAGCPQETLKSLGTGTNTSYHYPPPPTSPSPNTPPSTGHRQLFPCSPWLAEAPAAYTQASPHRAQPGMTWTALQPRETQHLEILNKPPKVTPGSKGGGGCGESKSQLHLFPI